jgi:hypothetical protein
MESNSEPATIESPSRDMALAGWADPNVKSLDCGFQYEPLQLEKSFRLLKLLPSSDFASPIECTISEQPMEESKRKYCARSYSWGATQGKQDIILNGRPAFVRQILHAALLQLRNVPVILGGLLNLASHLRIDALCINQQDHEEKNNQVVHMKKYSRAPTWW